MTSHPSGNWRVCAGTSQKPERAVVPKYRRSRGYVASGPEDPDLTHGVCAVCNKEISLRKDRTLRTHGTSLDAEDCRQFKADNPGATNTDWWERQRALNFAKRNATTVKGLLALAQRLESEG